MKRILFSPVGSTDPIAHQRDGALLHIIRKYRPDKAYLFFSKEIYGYEQKDNRYSYCLNKLLQEIGEDIEIELVGLCTDICVVSNALLIKAFLPEVKISVDSNCCAGVNVEKHNAAIETLRSCQVEIK